MTEQLLSDFKDKTEKVRNYISNSQFGQKLSPDYIKEGAKLYFSRGGKMLRPAILLLACEAVGGETDLAIPAAAAMEMSHIWTLVHDDILDNDNLRRGGPSIHAYYKEKFKGLISDDELDEWSKNTAILVGDIQQAWAINLMAGLDNRIKPDLFRFLVRDLTNWAATVLEGEMLDVEYSKRNFDKVNEQMVLDMLIKKTALTFKFAGKFGALIGLNQLELDNKLVKTLEELCFNAGIAFQLKDDILGILGNEKQLGKPIGSDIREGKKTVIVIHAYHQANDDQKELIESILGNNNASFNQINKVHKLFSDLGSIEYVENLANSYIRRAETALDALPKSSAKLLLGQWINFITKRMF